MFKKSAFTLIELLVVVAIIGILAAVGIPAYNGFISTSKYQITQSNKNTVKSLIVNETNLLKPFNDADTILVKKENGVFVVDPHLPSFRNPYDQNGSVVVKGNCENPGEIGIIADGTTSVQLEFCAEDEEGNALTGLENETIETGVVIEDSD